MGKTRDDTLHLRLDSEFKAQIEAAAAKLDIPVAAYARMALREYIDNHLNRLRETGSSYGTSSPQTPPDKKLRCAIAQAAIRTSYFVVTRNAVALAPPPQRPACKKDVPGG